jgi:hypothetical protein
MVFTFIKCLLKGKLLEPTETSGVPTIQVEDALVQQELTTGTFHTIRFEGVWYLLKGDSKKLKQFTTGKKGFIKSAFTNSKIYQFLEEFFGRKDILTTFYAWNCDNGCGIQLGFFSLQELMKTYSHVTIRWKACANNEEIKSYFGSERKNQPKQCDGLISNGSPCAAVPTNKSKTGGNYCTTCSSMESPADWAYIPNIESLSYEFWHDRCLECHQFNNEINTCTKCPLAICQKCMKNLEPAIVQRIISQKCYCCEEHPPTMPTVYETFKDQLEILTFKLPGVVPKPKPKEQLQFITSGNPGISQQDLTTEMTHQDDIFDQNKTPRASLYPSLNSANVQSCSYCQGNHALSTCVVKRLEWSNNLLQQQLLKLQQQGSTSNISTSGIGGSNSISGDINSTSGVRDNTSEFASPRTIDSNSQFTHANYQGFRGGMSPAHDGSSTAVHHSTVPRLEMDAHQIPSPEDLALAQAGKLKIVLKTLCHCHAVTRFSDGYLSAATSTSEKVAKDRQSVIGLRYVWNKADLIETRNDKGEVIMKPKEGATIDPILVLKLIRGTARHAARHGFFHIEKRLKLMIKQVEEWQIAYPAGEWIDMWAELRDRHNEWITNQGYLGLEDNSWETSNIEVKVMLSGKKASPSNTTTNPKKQSPIPQKKCAHCNIKGHSIETCYKLYPTMRPPPDGGGADGFPRGRGRGGYGYQPNRNFQHTNNFGNSPNTYGGGDNFSPVGRGRGGQYIHPPGNGQQSPGNGYQHYPQQPAIPDGVPGVPP